MGLSAKNYTTRLMRSMFALYFVITACNASVKLSGILQDLVDQDLNNFDIDKDCEEHIIMIRNGLRDREVWALKMLDASSHIGSDFVWGNNILVGSPRSCNLIGDPIAVKFASNNIPVSIVNLTMITAPMPIIYRTIHARHWSQLQIDIQSLEKNVLNMGFCLPVACGNHDSTEMLGAMLNDKNFTDRSLIGADSEIIHTKVLEMRSDYWDSWFVKGFFSVLYVIGFLMLLEMVYSCLKKIAPICNLQPDEHELKVPFKKPFYEKFLSCFSVIENTKIVASKEIGTDSIEVLHGLRVIGMVLFICGHVFLFAVSSVSNLQHILVFVGTFWLQPLYTIHLTLDTFFVLSGMVLSYIFYQKQNGKIIKNYSMFFIKTIVHRFMRLTPPYFISILMTVTVTKLVKDLSPYYLIHDDEVKCERFWWQNVLYINNFYPVREMCMIWSWFLGADFQCFVISTFLLLIMHKNNRLGVTLFGLVFAIASGTLGYNAYILKFDFTQDSLIKTADYLYTPFWARIGPYFAGVFAGKFLACNKRTLNLSKKWITLFWIIGSLVNLLLVFSHINNNISPLLTTFFAAFGRTTWAIGVAWIIIACSTGNGGIIENILSAKFFFPFSRLTYSAYLVNPVWIMLVTMLNDAPYRLDFPMLLITSMGFVTTVYAVAFIFTLFFENPFIRLIKLVTG